MYNYRFPLFLVSFILILLYSCNNSKTQVPALSQEAKIDSIKKDELDYPIDHNYLTLTQRAVIRPIYVETERNVSAKHEGYLINIKLKNKAQSAIYKDIKVEISYFSDKGIALDKEEVLINKVLNPGQILLVSKKVKRYKNTNYKVKLLSAIASTK
jgi:hypothetical protein